MKKFLKLNLLLLLITAVILSGCGGGGGGGKKDDDDDKNGGSTSWTRLFGPAVGFDIATDGEYLYVTGST